MHFIMAVLPIFVLMITLLAFKWPAKYASMLTFAVTLTEFAVIYKPGMAGALITLEKGAVMAVYMGIIAFGAMMLYNLVDLSGGFQAINKILTGIFEDRFVLFLMMCWTLTAFLQGIAGYGLPAVIASTILIKAGYQPVKCAAAALLGHSCYISFGTMGSSIYGIDMVTDTPIREILIAMSEYGSIGILCCGLGVCFIYGGISYAVKGLKYVIPVWLAMSASLYFLASLEMVSVIGFITGIVGIVTMILTYRILSRKKFPQIDRADRVNLLKGMLPYILVIIMSLGFFILNPGIKFSFSFPGYETGLGFIVEPEENYVTFNLLKYPFTIILAATVISLMVYQKSDTLKFSAIRTIVQKSWKKVFATEITLFMLLCTSSMMMDGGMILNLANAIVNVTGQTYPFMAAVLGTTGTFITGTNTNSNILFGSLQETAAINMALPPAFMCGVQSISGSVAGAIGPTTTSLTAAATGNGGNESAIYRYTLIPTIVSMCVLGIMNVIIMHLCS